MLRIEMLPAQQGDALWIEYGDPAKPRLVLIDGGTKPTVGDRQEAGSPRQTHRLPARGGPHLRAARRLPLPSRSLRRETNIGALQGLVS
jgi:hypothetical protein